MFHPSKQAKLWHFVFKTTRKLYTTYPWKHWVGRDLYHQTSMIKNQVPHCGAHMEISRNQDLSDNGKSLICPIWREQTCTTSLYPSKQQKLCTIWIHTLGNKSISLEHHRPVSAWRYQEAIQWMSGGKIGPAGKFWAGFYQPFSFNSEHSSLNMEGFFLIWNHGKGVDFFLHHTNR